MRHNSTAAWIWGLDFAPCDPVEATIGRDIPVRARAGIRLRRAALSDCEVVSRDGFRITCALRTVCDLGSRTNLVESVVAIELALRANLVDIGTLARHVETHAGSKGIKRLRRALRLAHVESESPMETRLRMQLIKARLPHPTVQVALHDRTGLFLARADLYYSDRKLVIEYDGENHKDRLVPDLRRQNALVNAGYHLLRFTVADLRLPGSVATQVRDARAKLARSHG